jgi:hypothetical protein
MQIGNPLPMRICPELRQSAQPFQAGRIYTSNQQRLSELFPPRKVSTPFEGL